MADDKKPKGKQPPSPAEARFILHMVEKDLANNEETVRKFIVRLPDPVIKAAKEIADIYIEGLRPDALHMVETTWEKNKKARLDQICQTINFLSIAYALENRDRDIKELSPSIKELLTKNNAEATDIELELFIVGLTSDGWFALPKAMMIERLRKMNVPEASITGLINPPLAPEMKPYADTVFNSRKKANRPGNKTPTQVIPLKKPGPEK